jgi:hypothetical protein
MGHNILTVEKILKYYASDFSVIFDLNQACNKRGTKGGGSPPPTSKISDDFQIFSLFPVETPILLDFRILSGSPGSTFVEHSMATSSVKQTH